MGRTRKNAFTLVELLAVIVILAIILVIAVPKIMDVINDSKKATIESTVKMIASAAEKAKVQNTLLGNTVTITCEDVVKLNDIDYEYCSIRFKDNVAEVIIRGNGKFDGLNVCGGTKTNATATNDECVTFFEEDDWSTIVSTVKLGTYPYQVGDTKTIDLGSLGTHTIRVSNTTPCEGLDLSSKTACGFVLEFADIITTHNMNPAGEYNGTQYDMGYNLGGWPASSMRKYINDIDTSDNEDGVIYNALPEELRKGIINTIVVSGHGSADIGEREDHNFESTDKLYLLSTIELWGKEGILDTANGNRITRQLDYYADNGVSASNSEGAIKKNSSGSASGWWLRSPIRSNAISVSFVTKNGRWSDDSACDSYGVSPAFRLAD